MTYYTIRWPLLLILSVIGGYFLANFFSKLTNINILSAIAWGFKSKVSIGKGFPVRLFPFMAFLFYPILFIGLTSYLETPLQIFQMKNHHVGGLIGYRDGMKAQVYDPSIGSYIEYEHLNPPFAANKFTEVFKVVLFYKYRPSSKYYKDTSLFSLTSQVLTLIVIAVGLLMVYISLYGLAEAYIGENNLQIKLSHHSIVQKFHEITGMPVLKVMVIALSIYVFLLIAGAISVKILRNYYTGLYISQQQELRTKVLNNILNTETLKGTVIRRHYEQKSKFHREGFRDNTGHLVNRGGKTTYYELPVFTVEFKNLAPIPVYLNVTTRPSNNAREDDERMSGLFRDRWDIIPSEMPQLDFTVNPDYTISLKRNNN
ncbi:MAG TPA: hypothetical protein VMV47_13815 [Bacteroidales bacterium]|nr:hypothetical protein [Bacteroidales bacterium]